MTTLGQQILTRLDALEASLTEITLEQPTQRPNPAMAREIESLRTQFRQEVEEMKKFLNESAGRGSPPTHERRIWSPKDCLPEILSTDYKNRWRAWSYKAKDWLAQLDEKLEPVLERVEAMTSELTTEFVNSQDIPDRVDKEIKRFLKHRLDGDPAEVVRNSKDKSGLEQFRVLAQLCDPTVGGRNWHDVQQLYHPTPASSL